MSTDWQDAVDHSTEGFDIKTMHTVLVNSLRARHIQIRDRSPDRARGRSRAGPVCSTSLCAADPCASHRRFGALDGLRGIAVFAVLLYHLGIGVGTGGWLGVDVFFVISGFVVTTSLMRSASRPGWSIRHYFWRRASRLMPTVVVALLLLAGAVHWLPGSIPVSLAEFIAALSMVYNLALVSGLASGEYLAHMWSLSVEWHFYLGAPVLLAAMTRCRSLNLVWLLLAAAVLVAVIRFVVVAQFNHPRFAYVFTPLHIDGLLLGCALAVLPVASLKRIPAWTSWTGILALALLLTLCPRWATSPLYSLSIFTVAAALASACLIAAESRNALPQPIAKGLNHPVLQWLGTRSYSLYVWHYIVAVGFIGQGREVFLGMPVLVMQCTLSLLAAELSFRCVEIPAQRWLNRLYPASRTTRLTPRAA